MKALIGGTQGSELLIQNFDANATIISHEVGGSGNYSATLRFEICDDFGVSRADIYTYPTALLSFPLADFWILQHERQCPAPFINKITIEVPIESTFTVPPGYEDVEINISNQRIRALIDGDGADANFTTQAIELIPLVLKRETLPSNFLHPRAIRRTSA